MRERTVNLFTTLLTEAALARFFLDMRACVSGGLGKEMADRLLSSEPQDRVFGGREQEKARVSLSCRGDERISKKGFCRFALHAC
jgi:hypothetical protein